MSGESSTVCTDPRDTHDHRCGSCGMELTFSRTVCQMIQVMPPCPVCAATDWLSVPDDPQPSA